MLRSILSALLFSGCAIGASQAQAQYGHYDYYPGSTYSHGNHYHVTPGHYDYHPHSHVHAHPIPVAPYYPAPIAINGPAACIQDSCCNHGTTLPPVQFNPNTNDPRNFGPQVNMGPVSPAGNPDLNNQVPTVIPNPNAANIGADASEVNPSPANVPQPPAPNFTAPQQQQNPLLGQPNAAGQQNVPQQLNGPGTAQILQDDSPLMSGAEQLGSIDRGQVLKVIDVRGNWVQLETDWLKSNAWIRKDLVQLSGVNQQQTADVAPLAN